MILSCDDASSGDVRVADLAEKYGIKCVFYWPVEWHSLAHDKGYTPLEFSEAQDIADRHEIGSHTITHRHLTNLSEEEAIYEIVESKNMLESLFNTKVTKFAPPRGYTSPFLTTVTLNHYESQRLTKGKGLVHVHPNSGANGNIPWREYAKTHEITEAWMHGQELDRFNLWGELEDYLREVSDVIKT